MDFSAFNPLSSNSLNIAARNNDVDNLERLIRRKKSDINCHDNRGWTCLHEAAAHDSYECMLLILANSECRPLVETFEGHTALYLACRNKCSMKTIEALLEIVEDIVHYSSTEMTSPLHVACAQGRLELVEKLIEYGAMVNAQDFDGDTPLHEAVLNMNHEVVALLLHAGAEPEIKNVALYSPYHIACMKGSLTSLQYLQPFITDVNQATGQGRTPLILAALFADQDVVEFLLSQNADPNIRSDGGDLALDLALIEGNVEPFQILLGVTNKEEINKNIFIRVCKPHYFKMNIITTLLESDLGSEFFNETEIFYTDLECVGGIAPTYKLNSALNSFLHVTEYIYSYSIELFTKLFYLVLQKGVSVNALYPEECPPLTYLHYCPHTDCFESTFQILLEHGCNVDYKTCAIPDAFVAALCTGGHTIPYFLPYTIACEPIELIKFAEKANILDRIPKDVQNKILSVVDIKGEGLTAEKLPYFVPTLKHLSRVAVRQTIRNSNVKGTWPFLKALESFPYSLRPFLRYVSH